LSGGEVEGMVHEPHEPHERAGPDGMMYRDEVFRIQGAIFEVNRVLGAGFLEAVYQEALALEFVDRQIPFRASPTLPITYKGVRLRQTYVPDFICFDAIVVELKALHELIGEHRAQVLNYLKAGDFRLGLLVNFGAAPKTRIERLVI
jgi:GxxExxY protein